MSPVDTKVVEVAVVGGGPVGSMCALALSKSGHETVLIDCPSNRPAWVELISPQTVIAVDGFLNSNEWRSRGGWPCRGIVDSWQGTGMEFQDFDLLQCSPGWFLHRDQFDPDFRLQAARGCLSMISTPTPARLIGDLGRDAIELQLADRRIRASFLIDATGASSSLMPANDRLRLRFDRLVAVGFNIEGDQEFPGCLRLASSTAGWWYGTPLDAHRGFRVFLTDGDLLPERGLPLQRFLRMQMLEAFGSPEVPISDLGRFQIRDARTSCAHYLWRGRWLRIGDAAFSVDPILGTGLTNGLTTATLAASCVSEFLNHGSYLSLQEFAISQVQTFGKTLQRQHTLYGSHPRASDVFSSLFWKRRTESNAFFVPM